MDADSQLMRLILYRQGAMGLKPQETLTLLHLAALGGMQTTVSQSDLAKRMGLSRRQVSQNIASLLQRGLLSATPTVRRDGGQGPNTYDLGAFLLACGELGGR